MSMQYSIKNLKELTSLITKGTTPSNIGESFTDDGIMYYRSELVGRAKFIDKSSGLLFISEDTHKKLKRSQIKSGDMLFSMAGAYLGKISLVSNSDVPANTNQAVAIIRFLPDICNIEYVYYYMILKKFNDYICSFNAQAAQPNINLEQIGKLKINLPSQFQQDRIVSILSAYDNLIEVNNKRIKVLEQIAENLYKEWFIRFRFPGHETAEFENGIPKGWKVCKFSSIANVLSGGTPSTENEEYYGGEIPFYTPKDSVDSYYAFETLSTLTANGLAHCNSKLYPANTIIITARGTVGNLNLLAVPMSMNQSCYALNSDVIHSQFFLFFLIKREIQKLKKMASGGVFDTIIVDTFNHIKVLKPDEKTITRFDEMVSGLMKENLLLSKQNRNLVKQRDLLLPRLMNGKLEV